ncbi:MAG: phasin family protein [Oxalobacteraceae bacterium]|nr:phasin family protein [Oxalobacteraceae bacterium]
MQNPESAVTDSYKNQLHATRQLAETVLTCTEKIDQVVLSAAHALFNEQLQFAQALVTSRDMKQIALLQSSFLSHTPDYVAKCQKDMLQICQETQNKVGKTIEQYFEHASNVPLMPIPMMPMTMPGKKVDGDLMGPMTDMFNVWSTAFREASTLATQNLETARNNFEKINSTIVEEKKATIREKQK